MTTGPKEYGGNEVRSVSVELLHRHVAYLGRLTEQIRNATGAQLGLSEVFRAFVDALDSAGGVNPAVIRSEEDLFDFLYRRLTGQQDRRDDRGRMRP